MCWQKKLVFGVGLGVFKTFSFGFSESLYYCLEVEIVTSLVVSFLVG